MRITTQKVEKFSKSKHKIVLLVNTEERSILCYRHDLTKMIPINCNLTCDASQLEALEREGYALHSITETEYKVMAGEVLKCRNRIELYDFIMKELVLAKEHTATPKNNQLASK